MWAACSINKLAVAHQHIENMYSQDIYHSLYAENLNVTQCDLFHAVVFRLSEDINHTDSLCMYVFTSTSHGEDQYLFIVHDWSVVSHHGQ